MTTSTEWILLKDLAPELGIPSGHAERCTTFAIAGFRPTQIPIRGKMGGVLKRWAVTVDQAQRMREIHSGIVDFS